MEQLQIPPEFAAALVDAQLAAKGVEKTGWNSDKGYAFATSEALLEEGRRALAHAGLAAFATEADFVEEWTAPPDGIGKPELVSWCHLALHVVHRSGVGLTFKVRHPVVFTLKGPDVAKPFGVARTRALGLFLRDLLLLPAFGEDQPEAPQERTEGRKGGRGEMTEARKVMEEARRQQGRTTARTGKTDSPSSDTPERSAISELRALGADLVRRLGGDKAAANARWTEAALPDLAAQLTEEQARKSLQIARVLVKGTKGVLVESTPGETPDTRGT